MPKLRYSDNAARDIEAIYVYISQKASSDIAANYLNGLEASILKLKDFPDIGVSPKYEELRAINIRMLIHDKYLIFYRLSEDLSIVDIIRVLHGSQRYHKLFN